MTRQLNDNLMNNSSPSITQPADRVQPVNRKTFPLKAIARRAPNNEGDPSTSPSSQRQYQRVNDQTTARSEPCQALCLAEPQPTRTGVQFHWRWAYSLCICIFGHFPELTWLFVSLSNDLLVTRRNEIHSLSSDPTWGLRYARNTGFLDHGFVHVLRVCYAGVWDMSGDLAVNCDLTQTRFAKNDTRFVISWLLRY